jgi:hypothetical protein
VIAGGKELKVAAACAVGAALFLFPRVLVEHEIAPASILSFKAAAEKAFSPPGSPAFQKAKVPVRAISKEDPLPGSSEISLQGIIFEPGGVSTAIINDQIVTGGESINDYDVIEIKVEEVILEKKGVRYSLSTKTGLKKIGKAV